MSIASAKMPAVVVSGVVCLLLGVGGGLVLASFVDLGQNKQAVASGDTEVKDAGGLKAMPMGAPGGGKGGPPGAPGAPGGGGKGGAGGGKGGKGGGFAPSPKMQLAQLVGKLDTLTKKPLALELTADQKKQAKELLADVDSKDALSDDEAKVKLEALLKVVEGQKETLEAAGYRWPGTPFAPPGEPPANPFKDAEAARLKSLRESLGK